MKKKVKQKKRIRKKMWDPEADIDATGREPRRFRGRETGVADPSGTQIDMGTLFTGVEPNGIVVSPYGVLAFVKMVHDEVLCRVDDMLTDGKKSILAPGDRVKVEGSKEDRVVRAVVPRYSQLSRPAWSGEREQVIAANVDMLVVVTSAVRPRFKPGVVDRYLITAELGNVKPILCLNKTDMMKHEPEELDIYRSFGLPVIQTSCMTGQGIDDLRAAVSGSISVMAGQSGVGKSSLLNALCPELDLATQEVSDNTEKGRHTTSSSRLYELDENTHIIDTPGIRKLGIWGVAAENLDQCFPGIKEYSAHCRFGDCSHRNEPNCAVLDALQKGELSEMHYRSFLHIRDEIKMEDNEW